MKFNCECGEIVFDQTDNLPNKGYILPDKEINIFFLVANELSELIDAVHLNKRSEWIEKTFGDGYPQDLNNSSIISDLISAKLNTRHIYECESCGRIWIEDKRNTQKSTLTSYLPENNNSKGILA